MKKGLVNPVIHEIRSARPNATRVPVKHSYNTYAQSIDGMAGTGYNRNENKLRQLQNDAKGMSIGGRPNPEKNEKRFYGLYGTNAVNEPQKAMTSMQRKIRENNEILRHGNANRRIGKSQSLFQKEAYANALGGSGIANDMVVSPKKGRRFKGQTEGLSIVNKSMQKNYRRLRKEEQPTPIPEKDSTKPPEPPQPPKQQGLGFWADALSNKRKGLPGMENMSAEDRKSYNDAVANATPLNLAGQVVGSFFYPQNATRWYHYTAPLNMNSNIAMGLAGPAKRLWNGKLSPVTKPITNAVVRGAELGAKIAPKTAATVARVAKPAGKALAGFVPFTDAYSVATSLLNFSDANTKEQSYGGKTNVAYNKPIPQAYMVPRAVSDVTFDDTGQEKLDEDKIKQYKDTFTSFVGADNKINPYDQTALVVDKNDPYTNPASSNNAAVNSLIAGSGTGFAALRNQGESAKLTPYDKLSRRQREEYGRFGAPVETRLKPNAGKALIDGAVNALIGTGMIAPQYTEARDRINSAMPSKLIEGLDWAFGDTSLHAGLAENPVTQVRGYAKTPSREGLVNNAQVLLQQGIPEVIEMRRQASDFIESEIKAGRVRYKNNKYVWDDPDSENWYNSTQRIADNVQAEIEDVANRTKDVSGMNNPERLLTLSRIGDKSGKDMVPYYTGTNDISYSYNVDPQFEVKSDPGQLGFASDDDWMYGAQITNRTPYYQEESNDGFNEVFNPKYMSFGKSMKSSSRKKTMKKSSLNPMKPSMKQSSGASESLSPATPMLSKKHEFFAKSLSGQKTSKFFAPRHNNKYFK